MKKIDREVIEQLLLNCQDYINRSSDTNMRERYCFMVEGEFICIEGNTSGWFEETAVTSFSGGVAWVGRT